MIPAAEHPERYVEAKGRRMARVEMGKGAPVLFQHGDQSASYLWRNVMPHAKHLGRCIAIDLIGMGDPDKLPEAGPDSDRFVGHRAYLDGVQRAFCLDRPAQIEVTAPGIHYTQEDAPDETGRAIAGGLKAIA